MWVSIIICQITRGKLGPKPFALGLVLPLPHALRKWNKSPKKYEIHDGVQSKTSVPHTLYCNSNPPHSSATQWFLDPAHPIHTVFGTASLDDLAPQIFTRSFATHCLAHPTPPSLKHCLAILVFAAQHLRPTHSPATPCLHGPTPQTLIHSPALLALMA